MVSVCYGSNCTSSFLLVVVQLYWACKGLLRQLTVKRLTFCLHVLNSVHNNISIKVSVLCKSYVAGWCPYVLAMAH